jgi:hypothetical protein
MSQLSMGILGVSAVALTCGAVQFALGRDLPGRQHYYQQVSLGAPEAAINRTAKADRGARTARPATPTQTISLRLDGFSATSFLIRVPLAEEARNNSSARPVTRSGGRKPAVACEPVVSVLTEVAKQLEPGRCIT